MAGRYGLTAGKELDGKALADAIMHDDSLYEDKAAEMGISPEMARRLDRREYLEKNKMLRYSLKFIDRGRIFSYNTDEYRKRGGL